MKLYLIFLLLFLSYLSTHLINISIADDNENIIKAIKAEKQGNYNKAVYYYNMALSECPQNIDIYNTIGRIYIEKLNNANKAIQFYLKGLIYYPNDFFLNRDLMYAYFSEGRTKKGFNQYWKLARLRGENQSYSFPRDSIEVILSQKSKKDKYDFCKRYLSINPTDIILREHLADIYMKNKDYGSAKDQFEYILENSIENGFIHFSIGICEYYLGEYENALISFKRAEEFGSYIPLNYYKMINEKIKKQ